MSIYIHLQLFIFLLIDKIEVEVYYWEAQDRLEDYARHRGDINSKFLFLLCTTLTTTRRSWPDLGSPKVCRRGDSAWVGWGTDYTTGITGWFLPAVQIRLLQYCYLHFCIFNFSYKFNVKKIFF